MHTLLCILGKSGSGKSTLARMLSEKYKLKQIPSFTTRPMRDGEVDGVDHKFITKKEFARYRINNHIAASTYFNEHHYGATKDQIKTYDVYVVDKRGVEELKENMQDINIIPVYVYVPEIKRIKYMYERGDSRDQVISRLQNDLKMFMGCEEICDYKVTNYNLEDTVEILWNIYNYGGNKK